MSHPAGVATRPTAPSASTVHKGCGESYWGRLSYSGRPQHCPDGTMTANFGGSKRPSAGKSPHGCSQGAPDGAKSTSTNLSMPLGGSLTLGDCMAPLHRKWETRCSGRSGGAAGIERMLFDTARTSLSDGARRQPTHQNVPQDSGKELWWFSWAEVVAGGEK